MIQEKTKTSPRSEHSRNLRDCRVHLANVLEDQARHHNVELAVDERKRVGSSSSNMDSTATLRGDGNLVPGGIDAHHQFGSNFLGQASHLTISASDVEHTTTTGDLFGGQGQDLLFVLGVGTFGEPIDPPTSIRFPEILGFLSHESRLRLHYPLIVTTLNFSVWPTPQREWGEVRDLARWADQGPWRGIWYADHFMPNTEDGQPKSGDVHECWSVIAAIAAITDNLRIGSLVSPTTFRHPAVLANTAATIDRVSNGRLILGIGAGWQVNEHRAYGVDMLEPGPRVDRFEEAITIIGDLLTLERTNFAGRHFEISDAPCDPKPLQQPLPILVGTGGPRMTAITARHAHEWNTWGTPETARERITVLRRACEKIGRDPATIRCSVQGMFFIVDDPAKASRLAASAPEDRAVIGSLQHIAERISGYLEAGYDEVIIPDFTLGPTPEARREMYQRFAEEVLPNFR